jgi:cell shape-determining protein MreC
MTLEEINLNLETQLTALKVEISEIRAENEKLRELINTTSTGRN